jgi:hypothetical protein
MVRRSMEVWKKESACSPGSPAVRPSWLLCQSRVISGEVPSGQFFPRLFEDTSLPGSRAYPT